MADPALSPTLAELAPVALVFERSLYYGFAITLILYGIEFFMYFFSVYLFLSNPTIDKRSKWTYIGVGGTIFVLITIALVSNIAFLGLMYVDHRNVEGGPIAYFAANTSSWWSVFGSAAAILCNFVGDGVLIYRCFIIWKGSFQVVAFPTLVYLGSVAMGFVYLHQSANPESFYYDGKTVDFGVPWVALTVALNSIVTALIIFPLVRARRGMSVILPQETVQIYTGVTAILVESALPFTLLGIIYASLYGSHSDVAPVFTFIWGTFCALSPQFIIFRVAMGRAWTRELAQTSQSSARTIVFNNWTPYSKAISTGSGSESEDTSSGHDEKEKV